MKEMEKLDNKLSTFTIKLIKEYINFIVSKDDDLTQINRYFENFKKDMFRKFWKILYNSMIFSSLNIPIYKANNSYQPLLQQTNQSTQTQNQNQSNTLKNSNINKMSRKEMSKRLTYNTKKAINKSVSNSLGEQEELDNILYTLIGLYKNKQYHQEKNISNIFEKNSYLNNNTMKTMKTHRNTSFNNTTKKNTFKYNMKYDLYADYCFKYYIRINLILAIFDFF